MVGEGATPWAAQFVRDLQRLSLLDDGKALLDSIGDEYLRVFTDALVTDDFCDLDVTQLRACELSVAIAPPGLAPLPLAEPDPEDAGLFACAMCNCSFYSRQSLLLHIRRKHRIFKCAYQCTVTNACCICGDVFSTRIAASRHLARAFSMGHCTTTRTYNLAKLAAPDSLVCPLPN